MIDADAAIELHGETFSPKAAEAATGLKLSDKVEPGQLDVRGRYAGQPIPYGKASLSLPAGDASDLINLDLLLQNTPEESVIQAFKRAGATSIVLHVDADGDGREVAFRGVLVTPNQERPAQQQ
jgi:hypothetical protein